MNAFMNRRMKNLNWWLTLIKAIVLLIFGVWLITSPAESLKTLGIFFGLLIIIGGLLEIWLVVRHRKMYRFRSRALLNGILDLVLGIFLVANPRALLVLLTFVVSLWLIFRAILSIRYALLLKSDNDAGWQWPLSFGIFLIVAGAILLWHPAILGFTIAFWAALGFISLGVFRLVILFKDSDTTTIYME